MPFGCRLREGRFFNNPPYPHTPVGEGEEGKEGGGGTKPHSSIRADAGAALENTPHRFRSLLPPRPPPVFLPSPIFGMAEGW